MYSYSIVPQRTAKMFILLWITIEMEYKIKSLKFILFFNGHQKFDPERVNARSLRDLIRF